MAARLLRCGWSGWLPFALAAPTFAAAGVPGAESAAPPEGLSSVPIVPLEEVQVHRSEDLQSLTVLFTHAGRAFGWNLTHESVFLPGARQLAHSRRGLEALAPGPPRTYVARTPGRWASAVVHVDGTLSGLFEDQGAIMRVARRNAGAHEGPGSVHTIQVASPAHLQRPAGKRMVVRNLKETSGGKSESRDKPEIIIDDVSQEELTPPKGASKALAPGADWNGEAWFPGCYSGDSKKHLMKLGIVTDVPAWDRFGGELRSNVEAIVAEASFIFEKQMNIKLRVSAYISYTEVGGAGVPAWAAPCDDNSASGSQTFMGEKLDGLTSELRDPEALWHLFTGCGTGWGYVGLAYRGVLCWNSWNTGVTQFRTDTWLTFAHELGHNCGARHSFEDGQGDTGGIMDYGDGLYQGEYQFNTKYRKQEMCDHLNSNVGPDGSCQTDFDVYVVRRRRTRRRRTRRRRSRRRSSRRRRSRRRRSDPRRRRTRRRRSRRRRTEERAEEHDEKTQQ